VVGRIEGSAAGNRPGPCRGATPGVPYDLLLSDISGGVKMGDPDDDDLRTVFEVSIPCGVLVLVAVVAWVALIQVLRM
jgi:hypothetical protein